MASHAANSSPNAKDDRIESLKAKFVGKSLVEVDVPAAVLDLAVLQRNCKQMLDVNQSLGLAWRAHIKTHKVSVAQILPTSGRLADEYGP